MCGVHSSLSALLETTVRQHKEQATDRGVTLEADIEPRLPPVRLCETFFAEALGRLIDNAIKFSRRETKQVTVSTHVTDGWVEIAVTDQGVGIAAEHLSHIFERFRQIDREKMEQQGIGVGLSIAQELIRIHGGEITVESTLGEGSTFTVRLPVAEESQ
jgi:signal transduction histidine kinase